MDDPEQPELLRISQAARLLACSTSTMYQRIAAGQIPGVVRVGASIRIRRRTLLAWLDERETPAAVNG